MQPIHILLISLCYQFGHAVDSTCRLTSVLFRHGNRSPMRSVPSDLHTESDWPQGYAQLTTLGVQQAYELGQFLRSWYDGFLSKSYIRKEVYVQSTDTERTLMSAQAVLSSLFIPYGVQSWQPEMLWQPIPIHPATWVKLDRQCKTELVKEAEERVAKKFLQKYKNTFDEIEKGLGTHLQSLGMLWTIYDTFKCEHEHNKSWPSWMHDELLQTMSEILPHHHDTIFSLSPDRGNLLSLMITDMSGYIHGGTDPDRKAFFYSAHDTNILCLLCALKVFNLKMPPYSTSIMIELHYGNITIEKIEDEEPYDNGDDGEWPQSFIEKSKKRVHRSKDLYMPSSQEVNSTVSSNETTDDAPTTPTSNTSSEPPPATSADHTTHSPVVTSEEGVADFPKKNNSSHTQWFVQIWLRNETTNGPYKLRIPGCSSDCPWESFVELTLPAIADLHQNITFCNIGRKKLLHYHKLWRVMFVTVGAGGVVMLGVVILSVICLYQHRKRRQRLQAIYRQLNTEDIPMSDTS